LGHNQPPQLIVGCAVNESILSKDDLKTCVAYLGFNQVRVQFVMVRLNVARFCAPGTRTPIDYDQPRAWLQ
jgi:hypothetical protein